MNSFHRPIEERIEPYNSKLILIPSGLLTATLLEKQNQFYKKLMNKIMYELKGKDELSFLSVKTCHVLFLFYHCFSKYYTKRNV